MENTGRIETVEIMTEVTDQTFSQLESFHSSKGNQLKWKQNEYWYKADGMGYEGLAEVLVSGLLDKSGIQEFVHYEPVRILYNNETFPGCRSLEFKQDGEELVTLEKLYRRYTGFSLAKDLAHFSDVHERIRRTVDFVENITGINEFGAYLTRMLEMDAFFYNEDRHTNNIALLYNSETDNYRCCPYFDMGLSLFSDLKDYPSDASLEDCRKKITAKPFHRDFDEQLDAANELYGYQMKFSCKKIEFFHLVTDILYKSDLKELYDKEILKRAEEVVRFQAGKYSYLFL